MTTLSFHIDEQLNTQLSDLADVTDRSKSYIMRQALKYFVATHKLPNAKTQQVIDEARTGSHLTKIDDFSDFLNRL